MRAYKQKKLKWTDAPTDADFPLLDKCVVCGQICDWQPRFAFACRTLDHRALLESLRPRDFRPSKRVVKICGGCLPRDDWEFVRALVKFYYKEYSFIP